MKDVGQAPPSLAVSSLSSRASTGTNPSFDTSTGQLTIRADSGADTIREAVAADGFVNVTLDGRMHSSDPSSTSYDSALAGATATTVAGIHFGGGARDTLVVGPQHLARGMTVQAGGSSVTMENVVTLAPLTVQAANITVSGTLQCSSVALVALDWVTVNAGSTIDAVQAGSGRISVAASRFVNSGQLHADGPAGGQILVQAGNILNAGPVTAEGTGPGESGGKVDLAFTGSFIATTGSVLSASSAVGPGGELIIDGGSTGRLYSSGRQEATGLIGGAVELLGQDIVLAGATISVSGQTGGGSVHIGSDFPPALTAVTANTLTVTPASTIQANALTSGSGGQVFIGANESAAWDGSVSARGGPEGGSGGFIDVSGHGSLSYRGSADAGASLGRSGSLVLDPKNIIISDAPTGVFPQFNLIDPHPTVGGLFAFGTGVSVLANGNVVVTNPNDDFGGTNAGAVYLFDGVTGALISSLVGSNPDDQVGGGNYVGGVVPLSNGDYVIESPFWNNVRGAATWGNSITGISGTVSDANSLVGGSPGDNVGGSVTLLTNGNYLVLTPNWCGGRGAVTWGNADTGVRGIVSDANSLVGSSPADQVGYAGFNASPIVLLYSGNYLVQSPFWNENRGAVTWGNGNAGVSGILTDANSLVGSNPNDAVGTVQANGWGPSDITLLENGNYIVGSPLWSDGRGAATWGNASTGVTGIVSDANSLVGSSPGDGVGEIVPLSTNGNYLVNTPSWNGNRGAITWANGTTGVSGSISEANSLVGTNPGGPSDSGNPGDLVGWHVTPLSNGNYVVGSPYWNNNRGAATWGNGSTAVSGTISDANSFVGSNPGDQVAGGLFQSPNGNYDTGGITLLRNGNYVIESPSWDDKRGAATWCNAGTVSSGTISAANSLVGANPGDGVGLWVTPLTNGNYVVGSPYWSSGRGAATWGDGNTAITGIVSDGNSLVGSNPNDGVGSYAAPLPNGDYLVDSYAWNGQRGAVTWVSGGASFSGTISAANSLVGSNPGDQVGIYGFITILSNGNYVVRSPYWNGNRGAVTWGSGSTGVSGIVSDANSLVGSNPGNPGSEPNSGDVVGFNPIVPLNNGNYLVNIPTWNDNRGAVTWGNGSTGISGTVSDANSLVGSTPAPPSPGMVGRVGEWIAPLSNGDYVVDSPYWNGNRGAVTWGNGCTGMSGTVSATNSLVGSSPGDQVGWRLVGPSESPIMTLTNGNYLVVSPNWNSQRGAVTWGNGSTGSSGAVTDANSLVGNNPGDQVGTAGGFASITRLNNGNYVVSSPFWNSQRGAVTWVNGATGQSLDGRGAITPQNSLVGQAANARLGDIALDPIAQSFLAPFVGEGGGRVTIGLPDPDQLNYARAQAQTMTVTPESLTDTLNTGTAIVLQASNDITINAPIAVNAGGHGGALTLQAGRGLLLNASITTNDGNLNLIANDSVAHGVIDSQRDPGVAVITMASGSVLDTGSGVLTVELRDGAGLSNSDSGAITLQTVTAGSVSVVNNGPSAGSGVILGPVMTSGVQSYGSPHGITTVTGNLTSRDNPITFTDSVLVNDGVTVNAGLSTVHFAGSGTQMLQSGSGSRFVNLIHSGPGLLQLTSGLTVTGTLLQAAGTFDANDQPVTVAGTTNVAAGTVYLAGAASQRFTGGLVIQETFASSNGPMTISGPIAILGGQLTGPGTLDTVTAVSGTVAPGGNNPGILSVAGATTFFASTTFRVVCNGPTSGRDYSQLVVSGPVTLGNSMLNLILGFEPSVGSDFEILTNTGGPIAGTFNGLPEGAVFTKDGCQFQITYQGGTSGNSVVLTRLAG
jgi:hypothetical protein